ncbi:MAG: protein-disulfide reductase DsbD domain-containing protein [Pseudomonadota bacterium]
MMMSRAFLGAGAACALLAGPLHAQGLFDSDVITAEVLPGWREDGMGHMSAIRLTLAPGWKTYWRAPGDAGIPPMFEFGASENLAGIAPHWPVPEIFDQNGMRSIGYETEVIIPLSLTRHDAEAPIRMRGTLHVGVCEEVCVPAQLAIDAALPAQGGADAEIASALADRPMTEAEARVSAVTCAVTQREDGLSLTVRARMPEMGTGTEEVAIETADPTVWVAEPRVTRTGGTLTAETRLVRYDALPFAFDRSGMRMTVFGGGAAVDIRGCAAG